MAEIFGAVASGAGLISLSMQLLESSQKLKSFYNASKDAPQTVADLSFELETMSLSLRQLVIHRQADISNDTLLGRCMMTCTLMTAKIDATVDKMEHLLRRSRGIGRMYVAFREPEILKLLEGLEHAKSSMLFAYMSYCQSWNLREASLRAAEAQSQNALLSVHEAQLQNLSLTVKTGHATILKQIETTRSSGSDTSSHGDPVACHTRRELAPRRRTKRLPPRTFRLALPRWLSHNIWEFAAHELDGAWNFRVRPVNIRPYGTFAFDVVRSGNVGAVRKLLSSGELSVSDHEDMYDLGPRPLLVVAAEGDRLELCEFLLHEFPAYYSGTDLQRALEGFIRHQIEVFVKSGEEDDFRKLTNAVYTLFLRKYGISADLNELIDKPTIKVDRDHRAGRFGNIGSNPLLTDEALHEVIMSQAVPFNKWHPADRFGVAVNAQGWSAGAFVKLIDAESDVQLARWTDRRGKTALHWAAEHFGCWKSGSAFFTLTRGTGILHKEYGELCKMLMTKGAVLHALDSEDRTPFTCVLRAMHLGDECWSNNQLCNALVQWGQYVQDAGVSLHAYVAAENSLQSRLGSAASNLRIRSKGRPWNCMLVVTEISTLAIEVGFSVLRPLWQYSPPPGAWKRERYQLEKIGWSPEFYFEGDECTLWQQAETLSIDLQPELVRLHETPWLRYAAWAWQNWARGVQDDHGFVCMSLQRLPGRSRERSRVRRAASLPPPTTVLDEIDRTPDGQWCISYLTAGDWTSDAHRCPLDLAWKSSYRASNDFWASRRRCMLGRCDDGESELLYSSHWEVQLLDDESNLEIARQFTDRFRPEWRDIVEENHRKRQRRIELGMTVT